MPSVETVSSTTVDTNTISVTGNVSDNGGSAIISHGFVYSMQNSSPTLSDSSLEVGQDVDGQFQTQVENLQPSTTYYIRAYATNQAGTTYGNVISEDTAEGPYFNIISPSSTTTLNYNTNYTIQWETNYNTEEIALQYFRDGQYILDIGYTTTTANSYSWSIGLDQIFTENNEHKIKIISNTTFEIIAESEIFEVEKYFEILFPTSDSQSLLNNINISWLSNTATSYDGANYNLELFKGSQLLGAISQNVVQDQVGNYSNNFSLDNFNLEEADNYRIKISDNTSAFYILSDFFEIISSTYTDPRDGNIYQLVQIGEEIWMAEDFRYTGTSPCGQNNIPTHNVMPDGSVVYHVGIMTACGSGNTVTWVTNDWGTWNWMLSDNLNPIPDGWRVPTNEDWMILETNLGMDPSTASSIGDRLSGNVGEKLKSIDFGGNDSYGFGVSEYVNGYGNISDCKMYLINHASYGNGGVTASYRGFERNYNGITYNIISSFSFGCTNSYDTPSGANGNFYYHIRLIKDE